MEETSESNQEGLYLVLISVHGLIRGKEPELGRDPDTGGQVKYVLELTRELGRHPDIARVDLLTRLVDDSRFDAIYSQPVEEIGECARIVRLPCGPRRYIRKELLWPHLDSFVDRSLQHFKRVGRLPDVIHGHYADAGEVGSHLAGLLGTPFVFTGHSLGREKLRRLLDGGLEPEAIEKRYNIRRRIEAEEVALENAAFVVASTSQEVAKQYEVYDNYKPERLHVLPPGVELGRFVSRSSSWKASRIRTEIERFLKEPRKPMILAVARADPRKNLERFVQAYGEDRELQELANLVLIAGSRDDISKADKGVREVLSAILFAMDRYDLYGKFAFPKMHEPDEVPEIYHLAARRRGIFVNPALTEPFGLTLIEAAAAGLPVVATNDGGPRDILERCQNGVLVDPLDTRALAEALRNAIGDRQRWKTWSRNGRRAAQKHFSWPGHVRGYLRQLKKLQGRSRTRRLRRSRLPVVDRAIVCDIDDTLTGDRESLDTLSHLLRANRDRVAFAVATGRHLKSAQGAIREWRIPTPDAFITSVGSEIHYSTAKRPIEDIAWSRRIDYRWRPGEVRKALAQVDGLRMQPAENQRLHKVSYFVDPREFPGLREIRGLLRRLDLQVKLIYSHEAFLDVLPVRASKGHAVRFLALRWGFDPERTLVAGNSGNDAEMLSGEMLGVIVGNHSRELRSLQGKFRIYFAGQSHAAGILEGIEHYDFLGDEAAMYHVESEGFVGQF